MQNFAFRYPRRLRPVPIHSAQRNNIVQNKLPQTLHSQMFSSRHFRLTLRSFLGTLRPCAEGVLFRSIFTTSTLSFNYYEVLGITQKATQGDIKAAYYKLSMLYHPDKNKDNVQAVEKFRKIAEAYEVLGNFRLRKLYDKGIIHTAGSQYSHMRPQYQEEVHPSHEPDDPQTKFYKAHMKKSQVPNASGRTPIYDFDEWSRAHYGASFARRKVAKEKFEAREARQTRESTALQNEILMFGLSFLCAGIFIVYLNQASLDVVRDQKEESMNDGPNKITVQKLSNPGT